MVARSSTMMTSIRHMMVLAGVLLAGCSGPRIGASAHAASMDSGAGAPATEAAPTVRTCPAAAKVPSGTVCYGGRDSLGAFYLVAVPPAWNHVLVVAAHGGPELGPPEQARADDDLVRWAVEVRAGFAWAGTTYHQGGVAVHSAAEDVERLRRIFVAHVAKPRRTVLHGQSWGADVAAVAAQTYARVGDPHPAFDGVLLSAGVLAGGIRSYEYRLDLRVIYQALCHNLPLPDEQQYPLWMGLPAGVDLPREELSRRVSTCLGLGLPRAARTAQQEEKLETILAVVRIPERSVLNHLAWGTYDFRDIAQKRTGMRNIFGNINARYHGSRDDDGLNASVARYAADPGAVAAFGQDSDPDGMIGVPVLTVHAIDDPIAMVEFEDYFRRTMEAAGRADHIVQTFTDDHEHSYLADPDYPALLNALMRWVDDGAKPSASDVSKACTGYEAEFGSGCRFLPNYVPQALDSRVTPRARP